MRSLVLPGETRGVHAEDQLADGADMRKSAPEGNQAPHLNPRKGPHDEPSNKGK